MGRYQIFADMLILAFVDTADTAVTRILQNSADMPILPISIPVSAHPYMRSKCINSGLCSCSSENTSIQKYLVYYSCVLKLVIVLVLNWVYCDTFQIQVVGPNGQDLPHKIKKIDGHTFGVVYQPVVPVS